MNDLIYITPDFAIAPALGPDDYSWLRDQGFKAIISNLPDGEDETLLTGRQGAVHAWRNGLTFRHIPVGKLDLFTDDVVTKMDEALRHLDGPIVAHCKSGIRSAILWAAASARGQSVATILAALENAGFDLDFIRDDLDAQADRARWTTGSPVPKSAAGDVVTAPESDFAAA